MNDDTGPNAPDEPDQRDERVATALAVPPLDDVTRRRLVRAAMEGSVRRTPRFAAAASVAAAIAVGALIGALLVQGPDEPTVESAQATPPTEDTVAAAPGALKSGDEFQQGEATQETETSPITPLGDLGDVSTRKKLRRAVDEAFERSAGPVDRAQAASYPCVNVSPRSVGLVASSAVGIGTYQRLATTVLIGTTPEGESVAVLVHQPPDCAVLQTFTLPNG